MHCACVLKNVEIMFVYMWLKITEWQPVLLDIIGKEFTNNVGTCMKTREWVS